MLYDTLMAIAKDVSKSEEFIYNFAYAGKNDIRTNFPVMYDEMTNCEKMIYNNFLYSVCGIVRDDFEDLEEELYIVYRNQSKLSDELIQILSDSKPSIADNTRILWAGGESYSIRFRNLNAGSTVTYKSSNSKIATVSKDGTVKPIAKGTAQITATIKQGGKSYSSKINIEVQPPQVAIINRIIDLNIGDKVSFKANSSKKVNNYEWSSSDSKLMKIDKKTGKADALATGDVTITVKNTSNNTKDSITFRIYESDLDIARYYGTFADLESVPLVGNYHYEWVVKIDEKGITYADRSLNKVWSNQNNVYPFTVVNARFTGTGSNEKNIAEFTLKTSDGEFILEFLFSKYLKINLSPVAEYKYRLNRISEEEFKEKNASFRKDWKPYDENELKFYGTWYNNYKVKYQGEEIYVYDTLSIQFKTDGEMNNYLGKNYYHKEFQDSITFDMKFDDKYATVYIYLEGEKDWKFKFKFEPDSNGYYYGMAKLIGIDSDGNPVEFTRGFG
ncbi:MAG: hypothetical protein GX129_12335 [Clostridiales bacterium]|nr:hypothetical protein [Clostridiales bacterium]